MPPNEREGRQCPCLAFQVGAAGVRFPSVQPLPIDPAVVVDCRALAAEIAGQLQAFIDAHSTVSIERTVLRAYGIDGANADGHPLVNSCVERISEAGLLSRGAAFVLGAALHRGATTPQEAAEDIAYGAG